MSKSKLSQQRNDHYRVLAAFVGVFALSAAIAHQRIMTNWEISLFSSIYNWSHVFQPIMWSITQLGSSWMVVILATFLLYKRRLSLALQVIVVALSTYAAVELAKHLIARPRPFVLIADVQARERFVTGMGFPSGHTAATTVVALLLYRFLPSPWRYCAFAWIGLVGLSRIYLGVHAPLDVVGGFALGVIVLELFLLIWPRVSRLSKHLK